MANLSNWIGIDDHADKWTIAQYEGQKSVPTREWELQPGESGYRKLIGWLKGLKGPVHVVYEAGPCGYELYRRLRKSGIDCVVAAPSLTPRKPGDRIKTNRRDAQKLATLLRGRQLTPITVPGARQEAVRDLIRAREAGNKDLLRARHQLSKLLLRYGHRYQQGAWTKRHWEWVNQIRLSEESSQTVVRQQMLIIEQRLEVVAEYDRHIEQLATSAEYAPLVRALSVLRGIDRLTAMTILCELGDLRRFATAPQLMAALGLVPSEYSTGDKTMRMAITKTGNAHVRRVLVEAAWQYQRNTNRPGPTIRRRREGQPRERLVIAERCDARLHRRFIRLTSRGKRSTVAAVAVARELAGFIWAIGQGAY
jgi:transposase